MAVKKGHVKAKCWHLKRQNINAFYSFHAHLELLPVEVHLEPVIRIDYGIYRAVHQGLVKVQNEGQLFPVTSLALFR